MRVLVCGAGAMGGFFGSRLLLGGADVDFLVRQRRATQLAGGLVVQAQAGEVRHHVRTLLAGGIIAPYDLVLLTCKAYDLECAMDDIAPAMEPTSAVLPLLNGLRHLDMLAARFGRERVIAGLTAINAALGPQGEVVQSSLSIPITAIGELTGGASQRCSDIAATIGRGGVEVMLPEDIMALMWTKLGGFCVNATITSLCRATAGQIAAAPGGRAFVDAVIGECFAVAAAAGYPIAPGLGDTLRRLFADTASSYVPSLRLDMAEGRRTEAEHTIGDYVERATRLGVATPVLAAARCNMQVYEAMRA